MSLKDPSFVDYVRHLPLVPPRVPCENVIKAGVTCGTEDKLPQMIELDKSHPLQTIIADLCQIWSLEEPTDRALKLVEKDHECYLTEKNRINLKHGCTLKLVLSCKKTCQNIIHNLGTEILQPDKAKALEELSRLSTDAAFAQEFIGQKGFQLICDMIENSDVSGLALSNLLLSFVELMEHGHISWDILSERFVHEVSNLVIGETKTENQKTLTFALSILETLVMNSTKNFAIAMQHVKVDALVRHIDNSDPNVQLNALSLMTAIFGRSTGAMRKNIFLLTMNSRALRTSLSNSVLKQRQIGAEMEHQLYVLQQLLLNMYDERANMKFNPSDSSDADKLYELRRLAFDVSGEPTSPNSARRSGEIKARDFKKLGFKHFQSPVDEFSESPPGVLALDCMVYFARHHAETFTTIVLENSCRSDCHECPFAQTCVALTKALVEILRIGEPPSDDGRTFYQMFFKPHYNDSPFYEFFAICVKLLNKTWSEMQATKDDLPKVIGVLRQQITRSLSILPETFEKFQEELKRNNYAQIQHLWEQERLQKEETELQAEPIRQLREKVKPEILELVKQNRLNCLSEGKLFHKYAKGHLWQREKGKCWFWKLSANHKVFHFDDCDEKHIPKFEDMKGRLAISEIKDLLVGRDCPFIKNIKKKSNAALAFSLVMDSDSDLCFNFIAPDEETMTSKESQLDLDLLLNMEVKVRLLETEGVSISDAPPPIPPPPPDFDFCYDYSSCK